MHQFKACDDWLVISKVHTLTMPDMASVLMFIHIVWIFKHIKFTEHRGTIPTLAHSRYALATLSSGVGYRSLKHVQLMAPSSLSSPEKCVSEQVQGSLHFGSWKCSYPNLPIHITSHLPQGIISCNCSGMNINHIFCPEQLLEWSPSNFFTLSHFSPSLFSLHSTVSFLLLHYTIPLIMKLIPPSPNSNFCVL